MRIDGKTPGAFGEVSSAVWQGRNVAVKRLKAIAMDLNENSDAEFQHEIEVNMSLRHKNIVYFFGTYTKHPLVSQKCACFWAIDKKIKK